MRVKLLGWLSDGLEYFLRRNPWILDLFLLAVPVLLYEIWNRMKSSRNKHQIENMGNIFKLS